VARPQERVFLGFTFSGGRMPNRRKIADKSLKKFKNKIRAITNRNYSISLEARIKILKNYINGWKAYFGFCQTSQVLKDLDSWIRRRLRCVLWKQWKTYKKRQYELVSRGVEQQKLILRRGAARDHGTSRIHQLLGLLCQTSSLMQ